MNASYLLLKKYHSYLAIQLEIINCHICLPDIYKHIYIMQYTLQWKLGSSNIKLCSCFLLNCSLTITLNVFPEPHLLIQSHNLWISCLRLKHSFHHFISSVISIFYFCAPNILALLHFFSRHQFPVSGSLLMLLGI